MPEIPEDDVEAVARALCDWQQPGRYDALDGKSEYSSEAGQTHFRKIAEAAIRTLIERGWGDVSAERARYARVARERAGPQFIPYKGGRAEAWDWACEAIAKAIEEGE